jgi:IK cytokine
MLGGDATHSILVKGLDYALLAARKAELAREGEEVADEELDALVGGSKKVANKEKAEKKEDMGGRVSRARVWS